MKSLSIWEHSLTLSLHLPLISDRKFNISDEKTYTLKMQLLNIA